MALTSGIVLGWAGLFSLYIRGGLIWGHWPRGGSEDPKVVGEGLHYTIAGYSTATMTTCTLLALFFTLAGLTAKEEADGRTVEATTLVVAVLSVLMLVLGPWVSWYFD